MASQPNSEVARLAVTCLGHVARIHRTLDLDRVLPVLETLRKDPEIAASMGDALDDIEMYLPPNVKKTRTRTHL
jgi:hypothetical protein